MVFVSAIILAAGESKRMGRPKLSMPFGGKTIIEQTINNYLDSKASEIIVVLGNKAEDMFRTALLYKPNNKIRTEVLFNLGNLFFKQQKYSQALKYFRRVLALKPSHGAASFNAAQCVKRLQ